MTKETPADAIENYYGLTIPNLLTTGSYELYLQLAVQNIGLLIGRNINIKNPRSNIRLELSVSKSFTSKTELSRNDKVYPSISKTIIRK